MISHELSEFVDRVMGRGAICDRDLEDLHNRIFEDTLLTRDALDVLIALDRAVPAKVAGFADWLVATVVDFAVWQSRRTGTVDGETAHWLVTTLAAGKGPTATARRIAFEIVREAQACDDALVAFAMSKGDAALRGIAIPAERVLLAG